MMRHKGIFGKMVLSIALMTLVSSISFASEEGMFTHPRIGDNPHENQEREDPHRRFRKGQTDGHSRSFGRGRHHGFSVKGLKDFLHLDDEQAEKMRRVLREYRKGVILKKANLRVAQIELDAAVGDGDFVISDIEKLAMAREAAATELTMVRVRALADAKSFLSEKQFRQFMGRVAHQMRQGSPHGRQGDQRHHGKKRRRHHTERRSHGEREFDDYE